MARQDLVEILEYLQRLVPGGIARGPIAVGLDRAQRIAVELVGALQALARFLLVVGKVQDQSGVQILEDGVPVRSGQPIDGLDRRLDLVGAVEGPGRKQGRRQIRDRPAHRLRQMLARGRILLLLDGADAEHQPRDAVAVVDLHDAVGELHRVLDLAVREHGQEGALQQFRVLRIGFQRGAIIGRGGPGIAFRPRLARGEIIARRRNARQLRGRRHLGADRDRQRRCCGGEHHASRASNQLRKSHGLGLSMGRAVTPKRRPCVRAQNELFVRRPQGSTLAWRPPNPLGFEHGKTAARSHILG